MQIPRLPELPTYQQRLALTSRIYGTTARPVHGAVPDSARSTSPSRNTTAPGGSHPQTARPIGTAPRSLSPREAAIAAPPPPPPPPDPARREQQEQAFINSPFNLPPLFHAHHLVKGELLVQAGPQPQRVKKQKGASAELQAAADEERKRRAADFRQRQEAAEKARKEEQDRVDAARRTKKKEEKERREAEKRRAEEEVQRQEDDKKRLQEERIQRLKDEEERARVEQEEADRQRESERKRLEQADKERRIAEEKQRQEMRQRREEEKKRRDEERARREQEQAYLAKQRKEREALEKAETDARLNELVTAAGDERSEVMDAFTSQRNAIAKRDDARKNEEASEAAERKKVIAEVEKAQNTLVRRERTERQKAVDATVERQKREADDERKRFEADYIADRDTTVAADEAAARSQLAEAARSSKRTALEGTETGKRRIAEATEAKAYAALLDRQAEGEKAALQSQKAREDKEFAALRAKQAEERLVLEDEEFAAANGRRDVEAEEAAERHALREAVPKSMAHARDQEERRLERAALEDEEEAAGRATVERDETRERKSLADQASLSKQQQEARQYARQLAEFDKKKGDERKVMGQEEAAERDATVRDEGHSRKELVAAASAGFANAMDATHTRQRNEAEQEELRHRSDDVEGDEQMGWDAISKEAAAERGVVFALLDRQSAEASETKARLAVSDEYDAAMAQHDVDLGQDGRTAFEAQQARERGDGEQQESHARALVEKDAQSNWDVVLHTAKISEAAAVEAIRLRHAKEKAVADSEQRSNFEVSETDARAAVVSEEEMARGTLTETATDASRGAAERALARSREVAEDDEANARGIVANSEATEWDSLLQQAAEDQRVQTRNVVARQLLETQAKETQKRDELAAQADKARQAAVEELKSDIAATYQSAFTRERLMVEFQEEEIRKLAVQEEEEDRAALHQELSDGTKSVAGFSAEKDDLLQEEATARNERVVAAEETARRQVVDQAGASLAEATKRAAQRQEKEGAVNRLSELQEAERIRRAAVGNEEADAFDDLLDASVTSATAAERQVGNREDRAAEELVEGEAREMLAAEELDHREQLWLDKTDDYFIRKFDDCEIDEEMIRGDVQDEENANRNELELAKLEAEAELLRKQSEQHPEMEKSAAYRGSIRRKSSFNPQPRPEFKHGEPTDVDDATNFYPCFEDEGLLFRCVMRPPADKGNTKWLFYNDTVDYEMTARATLKAGANITVLGTATRTEMPNGDIVVVDRIYPGDTNPFFQGKIKKYEIDFEAEELSEEFRRKVSPKFIKVIDDDVAAARALLASKDAATAKLADDNLQKTMALFQVCVTAASAAAKNAPPVVSSPKKAAAAANSTTAAVARFVDFGFLPNEEALSRGQAPAVPFFFFRRPTDYLPADHQAKIHLFSRQGVNPQCLDPGRLGDQWLCSAIACLCERPSFLHHVFAPSLDIGETVCRDIGGYKLQLCIGGWWEAILVDSYLPVMVTSPAFICSKITRTELWPSLLHKALAKASRTRCYGELSSGDGMDALQDVTGLPAQSIDDKIKEASMDPSHDMSKQLFARIAKQLHEDRDTILATTRNFTEDNVVEFYRDTGLQPDTGYAIVAMKAFEADDIRLVRVRNVFGSVEEWTGKWSSGNAIWGQYPHIADACVTDDGETVSNNSPLLGSSDDGSGSAFVIRSNAPSFWMEWDDYLKYFPGCCILKSLLTLPYEHRVRINFDKGQASCGFELSVKEGGKPLTAFMAIAQTNASGWNAADPDEVYAAVLITVTGGGGEDPKTTQVVLANSSSDWNTHSQSPTFVSGHHVGLEYTFAPSPHPYLIVMRGFDESVTKTATFCMWTDQAIAEPPAAAGKVAPVQPEVTCKAVQFASSLEVFEFYDAFPYKAADHAKAATVSLARRFLGNAGASGPTSSRNSSPTKGSSKPLATSFTASGGASASRIEYLDKAAGITSAAAA